jgi:hypothetical protein
VLTALLAVPVELGREDARALAREELAKQIYREARPSLTERMLRWGADQLDHLLDRFAGVSPGGYAGLVVVALLIVAAVVALRLKVGPIGRSARGDEPLYLGRPRSAAEHRAAAAAHAANGAWAEAVRERLRAVVRSLEERSVLEPRPGRTADEAAVEAGAALPDCAAELRDAARLFDEIWYGGREATAAADASLRDLDERVTASRPALSTPAPSHTGPWGAS